MKKEKSVSFNFIMNGILTASSVLFPIITFPYASRVLGPVGTGSVSFATSLVSYFSMFAQLGVPTYGVRACAGVRDDKEKLSRTVHELLAINLITCTVSYLLFALMLVFVPLVREERSLFLVLGTTVLFNAIGVEWLYRSLEKYTYITLRSLVFKFIALLALFALVRAEGDYVIYAGITVLASVGSNIVNFLSLGKFVSLRPVGGYSLRRHLKPVAIFFAMSVATTIYTHMDNVMLGFFRGQTETGYYDAAVKIKNILVSFVASLGTVLLPRVSSYLKQGRREEFLRLSKKALNFVFLLALPLCLYFILFAAPSIDFISGPKYAPAVQAMQYIMPTVLFIGLTNILGIQMLVPMGKEKYVLYSEIAGAIINVIVNSLLIPSMGAAGAAIGTIAAEFVVLLVQVIALGQTVRPMIKALPYWKAACALLAGGGASYAVCLWMTPLGLGSFATLLIAAVLLFGLYGLTLLVLKETLVWECIHKLLRFVKLKK